MPLPRLKADRRQSDQMALAGVCGGQRPPRSSLPCGLPQNRERRRVVLRARERSQVRDEQLDIFERRLLVFLEPEAEPTGGEAAKAVRLLPRDQCRQLERLSDRHPADLSRGHLGEDEVVVFESTPPPENRSEDGPARSGLFLPPGAETAEASLEGRLGLRILESSIRDERSRAASRAHAPSPRGVYAPAVSPEAPRLSRKLHLLLGNVQAFSCHCVATPARPPKRLGNGQTYGGSG